MPYVFVTLVIEEAGAVVLFRETIEAAVFVLEDADVDVAGDADVEGAGWASHDVGVAGLHVQVSLFRVGGWGD